MKLRKKLQKLLAMSLAFSLALGMISVNASAFGVGGGPLFQLGEDGWELANSDESDDNGSDEITPTEPSADDHEDDTDPSEDGDLPGESGDPTGEDGGLTEPKNEDGTDTETDTSTGTDLFVTLPDGTTKEYDPDEDLGESGGTVIVHGSGFTPKEFDPNDDSTFAKWMPQFVPTTDTVS